LSRNAPRKVLLTFDVEGIPPQEDHLDNVSLTCLRSVLDLLREFRFQAILFVPASVAEQLYRHPEIIELMSSNRIGYHGAVHSIRPMILEYTDVPDYQTALELSIKRETSHINPETGKTVDPGGILSLKRVFPENNIVCFRAPFLAWSPPHLDALKQFGVRFDFSSYISDNPVNFKGITFYPGPIPIDGILATLVNRMEQKSFPVSIESLLLRKKVSVLLMHPSSLVFNKSYSATGKKAEMWSDIKVKFALSLLRFLFERISLMQKSNLIEVTSHLSDNWKTLCSESVDLNRLYWLSVKNPMKIFQYRPRHTFKHFTCFFD